MLKQTSHTDCTNRCQSAQHGDAITAAITKRGISDSDLCAFLSYLCCCCESVKDSYGRTALHVAASCGRTELVNWLIENRHANVNMRDKESGYTPLHRSIFYGKIDTTVELMKLGANLGLQDANGITFLEHAMFDRYRPHVNIDSKELFTWGSNSNNSLGSQQPRNVPETMDIFHKEYPFENVKSILINQFHSVILADSGNLYSCGHGQGGRLGLGVQHAEVIPKQIKFPSNSSSVSPGERVQVTSCSIARDHSLFLTSTGTLYSCGLNKHRVLGVTPPPSELLVPKAIKFSGLDDVESFVAAGNYHSLVWNESGVFTWGLNAGQLGHQMHNQVDEKYILTPKRVKTINSKESNIKLVCASNGAIVVYTDKGDIYVLHEYLCRKIASRHLNLVQVNVIGGKLNHSLDSEFSNKNRELKVAALTNAGNLLLWQETDPVLRRCVFSLSRSLTLLQISLNQNNILFVTNNGEAFTGEIKPRKKKIANSEKDKSSKSDFYKFLEKDECVNVKVEKISKIHRARSIESDPKGHNFGVVQDRPYKVFDYDEISESNMCDNMTVLLEGVDPCDDIVDVVFIVAGRQFPAHRFILASRSQYFLNVLTKNRNHIIDLPGFHPDIFQQFLYYIYTRQTELIHVGELKDHALRKLCRHPLQVANIESLNVDKTSSAYEHYSKRKPANEKDKSTNQLDNPVRMLHEMAKRFEVTELQKILSSLDIYKYYVRVKKDSKEIKTPPIVFDKSSLPELYDVEIYCKDNRVLKAHKCILAARLDYFDSMFSSRWKGSETSKITMPFSKGVVEALLEYLYTDSLDQLEQKDVDQLFKIIILADQFFVIRLKDQCENILSDLLTIKNAVQLLTFADAYNADRLKDNCFEFIQQNMTSFLELRLLDDIEASLIKELSEFYQLKRNLCCRIITPYSTAVSDEEIARIVSLCPVDMAEIKEKVIKDKQKASSRKRLVSHKISSSEKSMSLSRSFEADSILPLSSPKEEREKDIEASRGVLTTRIKAIIIANDVVTNEQIEEKFTALQSGGSFVDSFNFPVLGSSPQQNHKHKSESKHVKIPKVSQKQRKRLLSESSNPVGSSSVLADSPKNPWKILHDPISPISSPKENMESIISSEKKQKENLVKIISKQLAYTQLEDKAIDELRKFYSVDVMEDEIIIIERVSLGAVALPVWVPKTK